MDETADQLGLVLVLSVLAWVAAQDRSAVRAAELLGAVDALTKASRTPLSTLVVPDELGLMTEATVRESLSEERFDAAFREGATMTAARAICMAVGEHVPGCPNAAEALAQSHVGSILSQMGFDSRADVVAWVTGGAT